MSNFNERLARLADTARAIDGGLPLAMDLMQLAEDIDGYLQQRDAGRHDNISNAFAKWNEFLNASVQEAYSYGKQQIAIERRKLARTIASDPRWHGGYVDALKLLAPEEATE